MSENLEHVKDACLVAEEDAPGGARKGRRSRRGVSYCGKAGCSGVGKCRECHNEYARQWRRRGREKAEDPLKNYARSRLRGAVRSGYVTKQPCEVCGDPKSHGHHDDYNKPLEVRWLCQRHHRIADRLGHVPPDGSALWDGNRNPVENPCISAGGGQVKARPRRLGVSYCGSPDCVGPNGSKGCRACHAAYMRSWRRARKELG